jgi:undecaprenyl-diphosphatase
MSAAAVYATVAFLAARLQKRRSARIATYTVAAILIVAISFSRLYLGVHFPSDVGAGIVVGLAWAAFCASVLEAMQLLARRPRRRGDAADAALGTASADFADPDHHPAETTSRSNIRS